MSIWLLPEHIADVLPSEARKIEVLRRRLLDRFRCYGYELVFPPMLEYLESLLSGAGDDLALRTFKLVDQLSGRTMGVRADITPQVSRIDAHLLNRPGVTRLCYAGSVLQTRPSSLHETREPFQIGAEIYGHAGIEADIEVQRLLLDSLSLAGLSQVELDLSHAGLLEALLGLDGRAQLIERELVGALANKDVPMLAALTQDLSAPLRDALRCLPSLYGDLGMLEQAHACLPSSPAIRAALEELRILGEQAGDVKVHVDLADSRGFRYHTGATFAAYVAGVPNAIARGGRYDRIGAVFGRQRAATGFSFDLREIARICAPAERSRAIAAPFGQDPGLRAAILALRDAGEIVIQALPGHDDDLDEFDCDRELVSQDGAWVVVGR